MIVTDQTFDQLVEIVREVAKAHILPRFRHLDPGEISVKSGLDDLVTVADREAEVAISQKARKLLPGLTVVGEEAASEHPGLLESISKSDYCLLIDPVDGTANFTAGLATFGTMIALTYRGETIFGMLYDPVLDDWISSSKGSGTWYRTADSSSKKINLQSSRTVNQSRGFGNIYALVPKERKLLAEKLCDVGQLLTIRCSCHEYRTLLFHHADFILAHDPKPWDHAAGVLAVLEAGGHSITDQGQYRPGQQPKHILISQTEAFSLDLQSVIGERIY